VRCTHNAGVEGSSPSLSINFKGLAVPFQLVIFQSDGFSARRAVTLGSSRSTFAIKISALVLLVLLRAWHSRGSSKRIIGDIGVLILDSRIAYNLAILNSKIAYNLSEPPCPFLW